MGSVVDSLFGGTDKSGQKKQIISNEASIDFTRGAVGQARDDALNLFPTAADNRNLGFQGALDVYGQTIPEQINAFQAGNFGAQQALLAGLPQFQNAILGLPTDLSALQPQQVPVDMSFAQQQLPDFAQPGLTPGVPQQQGTGQPPGPFGAQQGQPGARFPGAPAPQGGGSGRAPGVGGGGLMGGGGGAGGNPFADTFNAGELDRSLGMPDIGSLAQLNLSENGQALGRIAGALTGIPGLGFLGKYLGNRNIDDKVWMNPVDPNNPFATPITTPALADLFPPDEQLPSSPLLPPQFVSAGTGLAGNLANGVLFQRDPNAEFQTDFADVGGGQRYREFNNPFRRQS